MTGTSILASALMISHAQSRSLPNCDPGNGGLRLPAGFCALVVATDNPTPRHLVVAPNGDVYVGLRGGGQRGGAQVPGGIMALRDTDGDGRLETREHFGSGSVTGVALRNGYLPLKAPGEAAARPDGVAEGPDGSLYISEDVNGMMWRVMYRGGSK
jgi:glucose/arabinose dehydrogenase